MLPIRGRCYCPHAMEFFKAFGFTLAMVVVLVLSLILFSRGAMAPFFVALSAGIFLFTKYGCLSQSEH
ncbi:MAG: hypothetical protein EXS22_08605 [Pedosphaera sp.]|nr:hypothetical protein [Pedosphaera sp.]MSU44082.1 hypothetical protein [Pedosphaera sp.]